MHLLSLETGFACIGREPRQVEYIAIARRTHDARTHVHARVHVHVALGCCNEEEGGGTETGHKRGKGNARYRVNDECGQRGCRASRVFSTRTHTRANTYTCLFRRDISTGLSSRTKEHDERKIEIVTEYGRDANTLNVNAVGIFRRSMRCTIKFGFLLLVISISNGAIYTTLMFHSG